MGFEPTTPGLKVARTRCYPVPSRAICHRFLRKTCHDRTISSHLIPAFHASLGVKMGVNSQGWFAVSGAVEVCFNLVEAELSPQSIHARQQPDQLLRRSQIGVGTKPGRSVFAYDAATNRG